MLSAFVLWTVAVQFIDVRAIGPNGSSVGFATINGFVHKLTGVHMSLYNVTDWLGLVPVFVAMGFALFGFAQWIKRKHLSKVDYSIFVLGGFYIAVMAVYVLFEMITVNYRPVLINGILEKSYPSSTTLIVMCVMPTAIMQFNSRIKNTVLKKNNVIFNYRIYSLYGYRATCFGSSLVYRYYRRCFAQRRSCSIVPICNKFEFERIKING